VLGGGLGLQVAGLGVLIATVSTLAGFGAEWQGLHVQSAIFVTLGMAQLGVALALRVRVPRGWRQRGLEAAVAGAALLQFAGVYWSPLQRVLGTESLPLAALGQAVALAAAPGVLVWLASLATAPRREAGRHGRGDLRH
jgi:Ca2+-transporting ATPase